MSSMLRSNTRPTLVAALVAGVLSAVTATVQAASFAVSGFANGQISITDGTTVVPLGTVPSGTDIGPLGMTVGADGRLYVAAFASGTGSIQVYNGSSFVQFAGAASSVFAPLSIAAVPGSATATAGWNPGDFFVTQPGGSSVLRLNGAGALVGGFAVAAGDVPTNVAWGPDGRVYVTTASSVGSTNNRIYVFDGTGGLATQLGADLPASPTGLAFDSAGTLYVARQGNTIMTIDPTTGAVVNGSFISGGFLNGPAGLAFDEPGDLYVANLNNSQVLRYTAGGAFVGTFFDGGANGVFATSALAAIPEPGTLATGAAGVLAGLVMWRRRRPAVVAA